MIYLVMLCTVHSVLLTHISSVQVKVEGMYLTERCINEVHDSVVRTPAQSVSQADLVQPLFEAAICLHCVQTTLLPGKGEGILTWLHQRHGPCGMRNRYSQGA